MTDVPQYNFFGQTAIVTGGARGIGRAVAEHFLRSGAQVWIWDIDPVELNGAHSLSVDVANARQITEALASTVRQSPRIDILVNNAGYLGAYRPFHELDAGEWQKIVEVNLMGVFEVTRTVLPLMRRAGRGRIVNMGSLAGKEGLPNLATYSAASAGVIAFTKALSREVCDTDIRVNCVARTRKAPRKFVEITLSNRSTSALSMGESGMIPELWTTTFTLPNCFTVSLNKRSTSAGFATSP
jgi:NAD(P)-dependent dehydrogenase (short-subunit alcohol dehydrogenase family)